MNLHPRTVPVKRASLEAREAFWSALEAVRPLELTHLEVLGIIAELTATTLKYALRAERHPTAPDTPADSE